MKKFLLRVHYHSLLILSFLLAKLLSDPVYSHFWQLFLKISLLTSRVIKESCLKNPEYSFLQFLEFFIFLLSYISLVVMRHRASWTEKVDKKMYYYDTAIKMCSSIMIIIINKNMTIGQTSDCKCSVFRAIWWRWMFHSCLFIIYVY